MKKVGRNDPCPCGSGKKFKKCCESKMIGKRFMATKIETTNILNKSSGLSSIFKKAIDLPNKITKIASSLESHSVKIKKKEGDSDNSSISKTDEKILLEEKDMLISSKESDAQSSDSSKKEEKST
jgi:hypothetical protein